MNTRPRFPFFHPLLYVCSASVALAHPGHEGHEVTWDLGHVAEHAALPLLAVGVVAWWFFRSRRAAGGSARR